MKQTICCYSKSFRNISSSGGFCAVCANYIYEQNGIVYGAAYQRDFKGVITIPTYNMHQYLNLLSGSKYSYCKDFDYAKIKAILKRGKRVLFIGCPCQIKKCLDIIGNNFDNFYSIQLMCHGYSDPNLLANFTTKLEQDENSKILYMNMRYKHYLKTMVEFENGCIRYIDQQKTTEFVAFNNLIDECKLCKYKYQILNDVDFMVGDFWDFKKYLGDIDKSSEFSPFLGTNRVVLNETSKTLNFFNEIKHKLVFQQI